MKIRAIFFIIFILLSCKQVSNVYNGGNTIEKFDSNEIYKKKTSNDIKIDASKIIVLNDSNYKFLVNEIVDNKLFAYYGTVYDSKLYTADTEQMRACQGNYISIYRKIGIDNNYKKSDIKQDPIIQSLNIDKNKKTLIFLYSYQMGKLANRRITDLVNELKSDPQFDYFILSIDNPDIKNL